GCRRVGGRRDVARRRTVADGSESWTVRPRAGAHGRVEGFALRPSWWRRGQPASRRRGAHRLAARPGRTRGGLRLLRGCPRAIEGRPGRDRRPALRRARVSDADWRTFTFR